VVAIRSGIGTDIHIDGSNRAVLFPAHLHRHPHRMAGGVGDELLLPGIAIVNGLAGDPGGITDQILHQNILLAAVAATDPFLDDTNLVLGNLAYPCNNAPNVVRNLGGGMKHQPSTVDLRITEVRLERSALNLTGLVGPFNHGISFLESLLHITDMPVGGTGDVAPDITVEGELIDYFPIPHVGFLVVLVQVLGSSRAILNNAVVDQGSTFLHRLLNRQNGFEDLILHLDCCTCSNCLLFSLSHDGRHSIPDMANLAVEKPAVVRAGFGIALTCLHIKHIGAVLMGDDGDNTLHEQCFTDVDLGDVCMGIGTAQKHHRVITGKHPVFDETWFAGNKLGTIHLSLGLADIGQLITKGRGDLTLVGAGLHTLDRKLDRQIVVFIPGIANENTTEDLINLLFGGIIHPLKQPSQQ